MLSALIVNYHCAVDTLACVASLLADAPRTEVVVIDNSEDPDEVRSLRQGLAAGVRLLVNEHNLGFGAACNQGYAATSGELVMLLNPDARAMPGCLAGLQSALEADPGLGAVSPLQCWEQSGQWLLPPAWLPTGPGMCSMEMAARSQRHAERVSQAYRKLALQVWADQAAVVRQRALSGGAMMVKRSAVDSAGGLFDPDYFMYYEDSDLCLRLKRCGWRLGLVPGARALHEWQHSGGKIAMMEASKHIYLDKHFKGQGSWEERLARCMQKSAPMAPWPCTHLDRLPSTLTVPPHWRNGWLLEISPSPLLVPAIGYLGTGPLAQLPAALMARLGTGAITLRLGPPDAPVRDCATWVSPAPASAG